jgi:hypothetical protein
MSDAAIFQILNEVRGEEALSDTAFLPLMTRLICLLTGRCVDSEVARIDNTRPAGT